MVNVNVPTVVGVPAMFTEFVVLLERDSPGGSGPGDAGESDQV